MRRRYGGLLEGVRSLVERGVPWNRDVDLDELVGPAWTNALLLVEGYAHFADEALNEAGLRVAWNALKEPIMAQHERYRPGGFPWAWHRFQRGAPHYEACYCALKGWREMQWDLLAPGEQWLRISGEPAWRSGRLRLGPIAEPAA